MKRIGRKLAMVATVLIIAGSAWGIGPADKCEAAKNRIAGKYSYCRQKTLAKAIRTGARPEYSQCDAKLLEKWANAEQSAFDTGTLCRDSVGGPEVQSYLTSNSETLAAALAGIGALGCSLPASGQTTPYGPNSDGDVRAGRALSYTDNGDGTISDNNTRLMWEKKDDSGGIHDKDNMYTWCVDVSPADDVCDNGTDSMDGTIVTAFLATLNGGGGFAGHTDWRIPNAKELESIVDHEVFDPAVDPVFHHSGTCTGCTDVTAAACSCTFSSVYWTSTTYRRPPAQHVAWGTHFVEGALGDHFKSEARFVRAVRGGL